MTMLPLTMLTVAQRLLQQGGAPDSLCGPIDNVRANKRGADFAAFVDKQNALSLRSIPSTDDVPSSSFDFAPPWRPTTISFIGQLFCQGIELHLPRLGFYISRHLSSPTSTGICSVRFNFDGANYFAGSLAQNDKDKAMFGHQVLLYLALPCAPGSSDQYIVHAHCFACGKAQISGCKSVSDGSVALAIIMNTINSIILLDADHPQLFAQHPTVRTPTETPVISNIMATSSLRLPENMHISPTALAEFISSSPEFCQQIAQVSFGSNPRLAYPLCQLTCAARPLRRSVYRTT